MYVWGGMARRREGGGERGIIKVAFVHDRVYTYRTPIVIWIPLGEGLKVYLN